MQINKSATYFTFPVRVYWEDTDAGGIVFYANYLKFFERARTEWLRSLGLHQHALKDTTRWPEGTGIIAGGGVRAVVESAGIHNVLTKSLGTANSHNVVRATFTALSMLKDPAHVARLRGKTVEELAGATA